MTNRFTSRISELWNDRPLQVRLSAEPSPSGDSPQEDDPHPSGVRKGPSPILAASRPPGPLDREASERFLDRTLARFSDLEPVMPDPEPAPPATPAAGQISAPGPVLHIADGTPKAAAGKPPSGSAAAPPSTPSTAGPGRDTMVAQQPAEPTPRAVGAPLPTRSPISGTDSWTGSTAGRPEQRLSLGRGPAPAESASLGLPSGAELPSAVQRVVHAVRAALPYIQRILPLLDGNIGTAVSNLLAPGQSHRPAHPSPPVDLAPLQEGVGSLEAQQRELRAQIAEQIDSLKRVEDRLDMVREATDRNTLEQQELLEDLKSIGSKVNLFAMAALLLLVVSVMVNVILYLHIVRVLP